MFRIKLTKLKSIELKWHKSNKFGTFFCNFPLIFSNTFVSKRNGIILVRFSDWNFAFDQRIHVQILTIGFQENS